MNLEVAITCGSVRIENRALLSQTVYAAWGLRCPVSSMELCEGSGSLEKQLRSYFWKEKAECQMAANQKSQGLNKSPNHLTPNNNNNKPKGKKKERQNPKQGTSLLGHHRFQWKMFKNKTRHAVCHFFKGHIFSDTCIKNIWKFYLANS